MNKIIWSIPFAIIILSVSFAIYANGTITTLTTPNLNTSCDPISQKLIGYNSSGYPICATDKFSTSNSSTPVIYKLYSGGLGHTLKPFTTTSTAYVPTGYPTPNTITKHFANSEIWVTLVMDDKNTCNDSNNSIRIWIDGNRGLNWAHGTSIANGVSAYSYFEQIGSLNAGIHTISVDVRTAYTTCTATFLTDIAQLNVYEVLLN